MKFLTRDRPYLVLFTNQFYSTDNINWQRLIQHGVVSFFSTLEEAKKFSQNNPNLKRALDCLILKAAIRDEEVCVDRAWQARWEAYGLCWQELNLRVRAAAHFCEIDSCEVRPR